MTINNVFRRRLRSGSTFYPPFRLPVTIYFLCGVQQNRRPLVLLNAKHRHYRGFHQSRELEALLFLYLRFYEAFRNFCILSNSPALMNYAPSSMHYPLCVCPMSSFVEKLFFWSVLVGGVFNMKGLI